MYVKMGEYEDMSDIFLNIIFHVRAIKRYWVYILIWLLICLYNQRGFIQLEPKHSIQLYTFVVREDSQRPDSRQMNGMFPHNRVCLQCGIRTFTWFNVFVSFSALPNLQNTSLHQRLRSADSIWIRINYTQKNSFARKKEESWETHAANKAMALSFQPHTHCFWSRWFTATFQQAI